MTQKLAIALIATVAMFAPLVAVGGASASTASLPLGPSSQTSHPTFKGYYDGHLDSFVVTDVSSKAQASAMHINYSAELAAVKGLPAQYFIEGKPAANQISVFGSEPGESDYNPLWEEFVVRWNATAKPVLLTSDNQINALAKQKKLMSVDAHVVLNAPITKVGHK